MFSETEINVKTVFFFARGEHDFVISNEFHFQHSIFQCHTPAIIMDDSKENIMIGSIQLGLNVTHKTV